MTMAMIGVSAPAFAETVQDVNKTVVNRVPYNVEVCTNQSVGGDKSGDMLKGAIIGGLIGNNVTKNVDNGGAVGAILGVSLDTIIVTPLVVHNECVKYKLVIMRK